MQIKFKFSLPYERALMLYQAKPASLESFIVEKRKIIESRIKSLEKFWTKKVQFAIEETVGLKFKENVVCYLNSARNISDPLSIKIEDLKDMQDNLIHELIHVILTQNNVSQKKGWKLLQEKYKNENPITRGHILVHAVHEVVTKKIRKGRLKRIKAYSKNPNYKNSWRIVKKEGAENLLNFL